MGQLKPYCVTASRLLIGVFVWKVKFHNLSGFWRGGRAGSGFGVFRGYLIAFVSKAIYIDSSCRCLLISWLKL